MKRTLWLMAVALLPLTLAQAEPGGCERKEMNIQHQLEQARVQENRSRIRGLETALAKVQAHCTEEGLEAERQQEIIQQREEIAEREADLAKAQRQGDADKIAKRERKLAEARAELEELLAD